MGAPWDHTKGDSSWPKIVWPKGENPLIWPWGHEDSRATWLSRLRLSDLGEDMDFCFKDFQCVPTPRTSETKVPWASLGYRSSMKYAFHELRCEVLQSFSFSAGFWSALQRFPAKDAGCGHLWYLFWSADANVSRWRLRSWRQKSRGSRSQKGRTDPLGAAPWILTTFDLFDTFDTLFFRKKCLSRTEKCRPTWV